MENVFIPLAVAGVVELLKRLEARDYHAVAIIAGAALVGGLAGGFDIGGVTTVEAGIIAGLSASGIVTVAQKV